MLQDFLVGFRLLGSPSTVEALTRALSEAKALIESQGAALEGWDYDEHERLLLVHLRATPRSLEQAASCIADSISRVANVGVEAERLSEGAFARAQSVALSLPLMGFLYVQASNPTERTEVDRDELLALLLFYFSGCSRERALLLAPFVGVEAERVNASLERLAAKGYVDLSTPSLLRPGERLLDSVIPELRARAAQRPESVSVVDEEGNVERFSTEKLASSLYGSGVPYSLMPAVLNAVKTAVGGKRVVSKRALTAVVSSVLDSVDPAAGASARFVSYVYALDRAYASVGGRLRRLKWSFLRELSARVLGERGPAPPSRLVELHAQAVAAELRELVSSAPWRFEGYVFDLEELKQLARFAAPKVSVAWLELGSVDARTLSAEYWARGAGYVESARGAADCAERKELAARGVLLLSSALLLSMRVLPSNYAGLNVGAVRSRIKGLPGEARVDVARFCSLSTAVLQIPAVAAPREGKRLLRLVDELAALVERLGKYRKNLSIHS